MSQSPGVNSYLKPVGNLAIDSIDSLHSIIEGLNRLVGLKGGLLVREQVNG